LRQDSKKFGNENEELKMSMRYTEKNAATAASRLAKALGKDFGACWKKDKSGNLEAKVGCWDIDNAPEYGGIVVIEMSNKGGAEHTPLGSSRKKPGEFIGSVNFALDAIDIYRKKRKRRK